MGRRAQPHIGPAHPVFQIVPGLVARAGEVGHLVLLQPCLGQPRHRPEVAPGLFVVAGEGFSLRHPAGQRGALLHGQAVAGQVLRLQGQGGLHRGVPVFFRLAGEAVDEIQVQVFDFGVPCAPDGLFHLPERVGAVDGGKLFVAGGLHPYGQPVHPCPPQAAEHFFIHAVRIGLQGEFHILGQGEPLFQGGYQLQQAFFPIPGWGAAADVDAVHHLLFGTGGGVQDLLEQRALVVVHPVILARQGIEVAVVALAPAERDVHIQAQRVFHGFPPQSRRSGSITQVNDIILRFCRIFNPPCFDGNVWE